jgi:MFS transporter, FHS family, glucose/mannose:H+ symporter
VSTCPERLLRRALHLGSRVSQVFNIGKNSLFLFPIVRCAKLPYPILMSTPPIPLSATSPATLEESRLAAAANARPEWILLHSGFVLVGICMTMLGPLLPIFSHQWSRTDAQAGFFVTAQYFTSFFGVLLTGVLLPKLGFPKIAAIGYLCFAIGFAFLDIGPWYVSAILVSVYGLGYGFLNPSVNLRATQLPSKNVASAVSLLNFSWGCGAVASPFILAFFLHTSGFRTLAVILAALAVIISILHLRIHTPTSTFAAAPVKHSMADRLARLVQGPWIPLFFLFFFYVGTETSIGSWVATYEHRLRDPSSTLFIAPSVFYGFLLLGRGVAPFFLRRYSSISISISLLICASAGIGIIVLAHAPLIFLLGCAMAGLGCAPQYPIYVTWLTQFYGDASSWLSPVFFGAASLGGAVLPWLTGFVSSRSGSLRIAFFLPMFAALSLTALALTIRRHPIHQSP